MLPCGPGFAEIAQSHETHREVLAGKSILIENRVRGEKRISFSTDPEQAKAPHAYNIQTNDVAFAAENLDSELTSWSREGTRKIFELNRRYNGNLSARRTGTGAEARVEFSIDLPRKNAEGGPSLERRRVADLPGSEGAYENPLIEIRVQPKSDETEVIVLGGNARGRFENEVLLIDDRVSHGIGLRVHVPTDKNAAAVIDGSLLKKEKLTEPNAQIPLLAVACEMASSVAPNRTLILKTREGSFYRLPGDSTWRPMN